MLNREFLIFVLTLKGCRADHVPGDQPVDESSANEEYGNEGRIRNQGKSNTISRFVHDEIFWWRIFLGGNAMRPFFEEKRQFCGQK